MSTGGPNKTRNGALVAMPTVPCPVPKGRYLKGAKRVELYDVSGIVRY